MELFVLKLEELIIKKSRLNLAHEQFYLNRFIVYGEFDISFNEKCYPHIHNVEYYEIKKANEAQLKYNIHNKIVDYNKPNKLCNVYELLVKHNVFYPICFEKYTHEIYNIIIAFKYVRCTEYEKYFYDQLMKNKIFKLVIINKKIDNDEKFCKMMLYVCDTNTRTGLTCARKFINDLNKLDILGGMYCANNDELLKNIKHSISCSYLSYDEYIRSRLDNNLGIDFIDRNYNFYIYDLVYDDVIYLINHLPN